MGTPNTESSNKAPSSSSSSLSKANNKTGLKLNPETKEFVPHKPASKECPPKKAAWGSKTNEAVLRAAPAPQPPQQHHRNNKNNNNRRGGNNDKNAGDHHNRQGQGQGQGKKGGKRQNQNRNREPQNFISIANVELYRVGDGNVEEEKAINRMDASALLALRLLYLDAAPLNDFKPPEYALWDSETRVEDIKAISLLGSAAAVISANNPTAGNNNNGGANNASNAPPEEPVVAPLVKNEETRWKAKVFSSKDTTKVEEPVNEDSTEVILKKSLLILNKLSFTKFDKLSQKFIDTGIFTTEETQKGAIGLIVDKAQMEPHFSSMYAQLCQKLSLYNLSNKKFKKLLLTRCQEEFEQDLASKTAQACQTAASPDDTDEMKAHQLEYHTNLCRKKYLGHMRFIGELYKNDLISIRVMIFCLPFLLDADSSDDVDEEKLVCFSKLMTTIGHSLEMQSLALEIVGKKDTVEKLMKCWRGVEKLIKSDKVSSRVRFMLQDLMDCKNNGWITRRKEETAKTLNEIHREVAKEEKRSKRSNSAANLKSLGDSSSRSSLASRSSTVKVQVDGDGFMTVVNTKGSANSNLMTRNLSMNNLSRSTDSFPSAPNDKNIKLMKRSSTIGDASITNKQIKEVREAAAAPPKIPPTPPKKNKGVELKTPKECSKLVKSVLKEYFVNNDIPDAILSLEELAGPNDDDQYKDRIVALFESAILQVLEMKKVDVQKCITLIQSFCDKNTSNIKEYITQSLHLPLEKLMDIVIDAPLASKHLSLIVSSFVKSDLVVFGFFLSAPEYFLTDSELAAKFAKDVLLLLEEDETKKKSCLDIIEKLMTEDEKNEFENVDVFVFGKK